MATESARLASGSSKANRSEPTRRMSRSPARAARRGRQVPERCSRAKVRYAAQNQRALARSAPFWQDQDCDGRLRRDELSSDSLRPKNPELIKPRSVYTESRTLPLPSLIPSTTYTLSPVETPAPSCLAGSRAGPRYAHSHSEETQPLTPRLASFRHSTLHHPNHH